MANEINIGSQKSIIEVLNRLDQGLVSFEQAIRAIRSGRPFVAKTGQCGTMIPAALRMDLLDQSPYQ